MIHKIKNEINNIQYVLNNYISKISIERSNYIYAPLFKLGKYNGYLFDPFFKYLIEILINGGINLKCWKMRPKKNKFSPRTHISMWADINDELYFFDKSDHIQEIDINALLICEKYFKDNYNKSIIYKILKKYELLSYQDKIKPFFPTCDVTKFYERALNTNFSYKYDIAQILSLYTSPDKIFTHEYRKSYRHAYDHGFIRYNTFQLLNGLSDLNVYINLSSKDKSWNYPHYFHYLDFLQYSKELLSSKIAVVNTIPHRIFPWKVTEMICLGIPIAIDERPITQFPHFIKLNPNEHYLEIFPGISYLNEDLNLDPFDISSYSALLNTYDIDNYKKLFNDFHNQITNESLINHLHRNVLKFRDNILLNKELFFDYIINC